MSLVAGEKRVALSPQIAHGKKWRLGVAETGKLGLTQVTVTLLHAQSEEIFNFSIGPGGATSKQFSGSAIIEVKATEGPTTVTVQITEDFEDVTLNEFTEVPVTLVAGWADMGTNGGFLQPYYSYVSIYPKWTHTDIQLVDINGVLQWQSLNIVSTASLLNSFRMPSTYRLQAKGVGRMTVSWNNRR